MRKKLSLVATVALMAGFSQAGLRESYNVIKVTDWQKHVTYEVVTDDKLKELKDHARKEAMASTKAGMKAKAEWRDDETYGSKGFPRSVMAPDSISKAGSYTDMQKAQEKANDLTARVAERAVLAKKAEDARNKKRPKDRVARAAARDAEREKLEQAARALYERKLAEALGSSGEAGNTHKSTH